MINTNHLSKDFVSASFTTTLIIGIATMNILKKVAKRKDANLTLQDKQYFDNEVETASKIYYKEAENWAVNDLASAYLLGIGLANVAMKKVTGTQKGLNPIINGSFFIKNIPLVSTNIPLSVLNKFSNYKNHITWYNVFKNSALQTVKTQQLQILRAGNDIYKKIAYNVGLKSYKDSNVFTRLQMSQKLLNQYSKQGLKTITYTNGARYSIVDYSEMLARTMTSRTALQASLNRYQQKGYSLCMVSSHFRACDLCTPYEGQILSMDGKDRRYESIWDAELQGLFHPNCLHDISIWDESIEVPKPSVDQSEQKLIDQYGYKNAQVIAYNAQQRQRAIERNIRKYKTQKELSLTSSDKARNQAKISQWQQAQRTHLIENPYLVRKYSREQIGKAH